MPNRFEQVASKVPAVTSASGSSRFLTTLGETGGDTLTMTWLKADVMVNNGYLVGSAIFLSILIVLIGVQIAAKRFHLFLYWLVIVASTTAGTAMADFATRSLGIGHTGGSVLLFACLMAVLSIWYWTQGSISVESINTPKVEMFYWAAITFSQTLGMALGDWIADRQGSDRPAAFSPRWPCSPPLITGPTCLESFCFGSLCSRTRPLGATVGDFLDKPLDDGD